MSRQIKRMHIYSSDFIQYIHHMHLSFTQKQKLWTKLLKIVNVQERLWNYWTFTKVHECSWTFKNWTDDR
jgi:hypothetical protein